MNSATMSVLAVPLADGDVGVEQTVRAMRALIDQGKKSPRVRGQVAWILNRYHIPAFDFRGEFRAIFHWIVKNIRWTRDATDKEGLQSADQTLEWRIGDCDDFSTLMCSCLGAIGFRTRLVTISNHAEDPTQFSHIYCEVQLDDQWIPMDAGRRKPAFGKGPRNYFRRRNWDNDTGEFEDVQLGGPPMRAPGFGFATPYWRPGPAGRLHQPVTLHLGQNEQNTSDWSQLLAEAPSLISTAATGTAQIITAENQPAVAQAQYGAAYNAAVLASQTNPLGTMFSGSGGSMLLLLGLGLLAVMAISRRNN